MSTEIKKKSVKKLQIQIKPGVWQEIEEKDQPSFLAKHISLSEDHTKSLWSAVKGGKDFDDCEGMEEVPVVEKKKLKTGFEKLKKVLDSHEKRKAYLDAEAEKAEEAERIRGEKLALAVQAGSERALGYRDSGVEGIQQVVGDDFEVTAIGLSPKKGVTLTEESLASAISGLAGAEGNIAIVRGSIMWSIGDAGAIAESMSGNAGEEIISHAASVTGRSKHTINQAIKQCKFFPQDERIEGLSYTHHQEVYNYKDILTTAKVSTKDALAQALKGEKIRDEIDAKGKKKEVWAPMSIKDFRKWLQSLNPEQKAKDAVADAQEVVDDADGSAPAPKAAKESAKPQYLYLDYRGEAGMYYVDENLHLNLCQEDSVFVFDLKALKELDREGKEQSSILPLPNDMKDSTEVETQEVEDEEIPG